jgi:hypothetical protein
MVYNFVLLELSASVHTHAYTFQLRPHESLQYHECQLLKSSQGSFDRKGQLPKFKLIVLVYRCYVVSFPCPLARSDRPPFVRTGIWFSTDLP